MNLPYKIRLSIYLSGASSLIVLVAFLLIFGVAKWTLLRNIDKDLALETKVHQDQITIIDGSIRFSHKDEWEEEEHKEIQFHPIFIEIVDKEGNQLDKSPNLGNLRLGFINGHSSQDNGYNQFMGNQELRQMQISLKHEEKIEGYLLVATSFEESRNLLNNLRTKMISQKNLNERIQLPVNNDEIKALTVAINDLLERLENAMKREQQFTSDASHELRTPLSVLKGNFEVLIRKPRSEEEYVSKIKNGLEEIEKLESIIDQLLALARVQKDAWDIHEIDLESITLEVTESIRKSEGRKIRFTNQSKEPLYVFSNEKSLFIILTNLIQNALKYSENLTEISVTIWIENSTGILEVKDHGIGIEKEAQSKIFNPFFRENSQELGKIQGSGLGLSIVKKLCDHLGIYISLESEKGQGTAIRLIFPDKI